ncbi:pleiotropic drug resistance protein 2-like [Andrographis paniculata]|uniref:pleiotropic drug resistance protein 2-like n=1 Tax=Andrographis paniculata TaxID=175694 RepID=UPI0021E77F00|nr:pleiotropic drug resistance protein 2-like [Andrographis paniculata]
MAPPPQSAGDSPPVSRRFRPAADAAGRATTRGNDDREELLWAAIERLPTFDRATKGIMKTVSEEGKELSEQVDFANLRDHERAILVGNVLRAVGNDPEKFLRRLRERIDRVGIDVPKVEVRYEHLSIEGETYVASRALPTLLNVTLNAIEGLIEKVKILPSKKQHIKLLDDVSGILRPSRMTLLLGPPGADKTEFLKSLAGNIGKDLRVSGRITYNGYELSEFVPQKISSYVGQQDLHHGEMTVRETLDFAARCLGVGTRYDLLVELSRREKEAGIKPDPEIDAFMKSTAIAGQECSLATDYILKILELEICADTLVGDVMRRGISGGQKKRLTIGEMLVGPAGVFYMDEISNGLDSSTTFQIIKYLKQMVRTMDTTMLMSLLQPAPETFELFDDIILLVQGHIVYHGPRDSILEFFEGVGFKCPERKSVADFLQEVTSMKDQEQYWFQKNEPYRYVPSSELASKFSSFSVGKKLIDDLSVPYEKSEARRDVLITSKYGLSNVELLKTCLAREWLMMKRNALFYVFKMFQITIMAIIAFTVFFRTEMKFGHLEDGRKVMAALFFSLNNVMFNSLSELGLTVYRLPLFFKQRDAHFYPAWAFSLPIWIFGVPLSVMESSIWTGVTYYTIGFAPSASRFFRQLLVFVIVHQMGLSLFRFIAVIGRSIVTVSILSAFTLVLIFDLAGFIIDRDELAPWMLWGYYASPMMYGQSAIAINEFLDERWSRPNTDPRFAQATVGKVLLKSRAMFSEDYMYWICVSALLSFSIFFTICFTVALAYLDPLGGSESLAIEAKKVKEKKDDGNEEESSRKRGMVLPFTPLWLAFDHVNYYVDMPMEMRKRGVSESRLRLLRDVSGAFRPGILTALVGESGAGKTTLMDVLAGRKTSGHIEGNIIISGYPKNQSTFARISGYCEQIDIHSPQVTVYESLVYSAWLRLSPEVTEETRKMFVEEVMELIELNPVRDALVGLPGVNGLSLEQRKRLTIAVELVANPSIIFMDEPTSGLDARAAAIVMRTVRSTVDTGRTVVCTIHQPSIDIFESFDELLLMKRGGQVIYAGPLGHHSCHLIEYFASVPGIPLIKDGYNPATWMLDLTTPAVEAQLNVDFAEVYANSDLHRRNQELVRELSSPGPDSQDLHFPTKYAQPFTTQCKACFWKQNLSYWRHPEYNAARVLVTLILGVLFGAIFWNGGQKLSTEQDLMTLLGAMYASVIFLGGTSAFSVQSVISVERTVFYREKAAGMYSALPYAFSQVAIETVYVAIQTLVYTLLLFSMVGFEWRADKFCWFYYYMFMCFVYFIAYGMMLVALTPNFQIAAITMSFFLSFWNLFSGFIILKREIPVWWRWYLWCSPVSWTINGLITSQLGDRTEVVRVPGVAGDVLIKDYFDRFLGFRHDLLGAVAAAHLGWVLLFSTLFAFGIKHLNFQRK